ncbi:hypothetical protein SanaruYs_08140 [Chryseotalea sanaruensis]|uniref:Acyltransferase n=1 Tax=Chryseotalea sanaruensis TaxID=2482724 RepID=A0A401U6U6_9BACT|nr:acyltransferase [Chryseotalea sanaruensis]GCC50599.1 hypothetical protein SanaruYs_08140 [Chryseotalea sanaruensis]
MKYFKIIIQIFCFLFPWPVRKLGLKIFLGFVLERNSKIGFSIILAKQVVLKKGSLIKSGTFINAIDSLILHEFAKIGSFNWITGASIRTEAYRRSVSRKCELVLGVHTRITDRHYMDCNGGIYVGDFTTIAGVRSQFITHGINIKDNCQEADPILIGKYCMIGTGVIVLKGSILPDYSVLAAGAILNKPMHASYTVYAGNPAQSVKSLDDQAAYFTRDTGNVN